ncbi:hypothetical protein COT94_00755 [Candidatus Falkowbacteria bacterium CG10_big_fil_rev_8_21_14_0_10_37_14]|uniref:AtpZ/AtpI family protein n=1 Tax=Candidatus Falkowbacteria bacterium CG10_big_fil_rev_8_21_14_0_10_37_14 TaxID=1974561 RepID=A0A2M6WUF7_9BACT|nr:AtpZ/AtpI family protein [Candidatus Falkowbacteria bacterium]PIT96351.1 MAG: hypothetical protein COT94_00755 [Candidatus Falkowbacteria bacterium CG10_big_fil_rev_8_21_14_0_10_37_14]
MIAKEDYQPALVLFGKLSVWIGLPAVIALFAGNWLDERLNTAPWGLLSVTMLAFVISMFGLVKEAMASLKNIKTPSAKDSELKKD